MGAFQNEVFKQPRGFLRCIQWFFAMVAFSTCAGFYFYISFTVTCKSPNNNQTAASEEVAELFSYPFQLDHIRQTNYTLKDCNGKGDKVFTISFPGDYSSDSKFYVFIGVICWLYTMATIYFYSYFSDIYEDPQKNFPLYDLIVTAIFAFFWLASSSAWANAVLGLKSIANPDSWLKDTYPICIDDDIESCSENFVDSFGGANVSILIGFLNLFLWSVNCWYLYKETKFFMPTTAGNLQNVESPTESA